MAAASVAYSLCSTLDGAKNLHLELAFFSAIAAVPRKHNGVNTKRNAEQKHSALKLLQRKIKAQTRTNLVQEKKYSDRLIEALRKYHTNSLL